MAEDKGSFFSSCSRTKVHTEKHQINSPNMFFQLDVKLQVEYMSFSAHADAKGIMQLIRMAEPRNMLLVHGEAAKMEFLKGKIEQEFSAFSVNLPSFNVNPTEEPSDLISTFLTDIDCYMPANGETVTMTTNPSVPVDISLNLLKREMVLGGA